jgi:DinB superfamily
MGNSFWKNLKRRGLKESYAGLSGSQLTEPGIVGDWSVKDILAHVTTWEEALKYLPLIIEGRRPPRYITYGGINAFNAQSTEQERSLSLSDVLRQLDEIHSRLINYIQSVPEEQFTRETRFRRRLRLDTYSHYPLHSNLRLPPPLGNALPKACSSQLFEDIVLHSLSSNP